MNIVILKGRLTKDINLLFGQSGTAYTSFTVAVNRYSKDKDLTILYYVLHSVRQQNLYQSISEKGKKF